MIHLGRLYKPGMCVYQRISKFSILKLDYWFPSGCYIIIFRAMDTQGLIGNIGGYIGLVLGYSLLQIPDFIIFILGKTKGWCSGFKERRYRNQTKAWNVIQNDKVSASKSPSIKESTENRDTKRDFVSTNARFESVIERI